MILEYRLGLEAKTHTNKMCFMGKVLGSKCNLSSNPKAIFLPVH